NKKLLSYSAFASSFLAIGNTTKAQIIYTDIDPDTTFELSMWTIFSSLERIYPIDINADGINEFAFYMYSQSFSTSEGSASHKILLENYDGNYIRNNTTSAIIWGVEAIHDLDTIDAADNWNGDDRILLVRTSSDFAYTSGSDLTFFDTGGNWHTQVDKFIGVRFKLDSNFHYGWIRLTVQSNLIDSYDYLTIKSYAYEAAADTPILAGEDSVSVGEIEEPLSVTSSNNNFLITTYQNHIQINLLESNQQTMQLFIHDIAGKKVFADKISQQQTTFELMLTTGIYIATLQSENKIYSQKIIIQ
ncbi:MAG: T9SS type A sorting domain-containing protein, partial [Fimbriimonadaceae bacterium]|nr:T9SS type A sorting domain-containing protein [Chitinophagales bacterium]